MKEYGQLPYLVLIRVKPTDSLNMKTNRLTQRCYCLGLGENNKKTKLIGEVEIFLKPDRPIYLADIRYIDILS